MNVVPKKWEKWPHVTQTQQFTWEDLEAFMDHEAKVEEALVGGKLKCLRLSHPWAEQRVLKIYRDEPSTRTEDTFCDAARRLGYHVELRLGSFSSALKGEDIEDTGMVITQVAGMGQVRSCDILVIRSKEEGAADKVAEVVEEANSDGVERMPLPVINAGDGAHQHPTQALTDLATIYQERRRQGVTGHPLENFTLAIVGDIGFSRTVNSLCHLFGRFADLKPSIIFCSHPAIRPKEGILEYFNRHHVTYEFRQHLKDCLPDADAFYMTRAQNERHPDEETKAIFREIRDSLVFQEAYLELMRPKAFIMHPMPINRNPKPGDPPPEIDLALSRRARRNDPRCAWARQSFRGTFVRYSLLDIIDCQLQADGWK